MMKWFYDLKIAVKLLISFVVLALIAGIVGLVGVINIRTIDSKYSSLFEDFGVALGDVGDVSAYLQQIRVKLRDVIIAKDMSEKNTYVQDIRNLDQKIKDSMTKFKNSLKTSQGQQLFDELQEGFDAFDPIRDKIISLALAGQEEQAISVVRNEGSAPVKAIDEAVNQLVDLKKSTGRQYSVQYSRNTSTTVYTMLIVVAVAMIMAVCFGIFISRIINKPLMELMGAANKIANGNLNVEVEASTKDEIGDLSKAFDKMARSMNEVLTGINSSAEQVAAGARQVSASGQMLSQSSTEQASSIEEITSSMTEVAAQTTQNAESAREASMLAANVQDRAGEGNQQMQEMLKAMEAINDSSTSISKIIKVIDEIAFQTNILALNAAVEAARAGQHGKGFAVVAEEVRNLAARSAHAAKETTDMIEGSIKKVDLGTKIANQTAEALDKIVNGIAKTAELVVNIAAASNEQAAGINQVNQAIEQVAQTVQTNSATAEESASASEELSSQAEVLKNMVMKFELKDIGAAIQHYINENDRYAAMRNCQKEHYSNLNLEGKNEAAVGSVKMKIALDDREFGKY